MKARDYELILLCGFLRNRKAYAELSYQVQPESFTEPDLRSIFDAMQTSGDRVTIPELASAVEGQGGHALISDVLGCWKRYKVDRTFPSNDIERYARVVERSGRFHQINTVLEESMKVMGSQKFSKLNTTEFVSDTVSRLVDIEFKSADQQGFREFDYYASKFVNQLGYILRGEQPVDRTPVHMRTFDVAMGGGLPSDLIILGGQPGSGKTQLAWQWAIDVAKSLRDNEEVGVVAVNSAEMLGVSLASRAVLSAAGIDSALLRSGGYNQDKEAIRRIRDELLRLKGLPLFVDDSSYLTSNIISARVSALRARYRKVVLVVTDFAELINDKGESVEQRVARVFINAKALSKTLGIPVILLSQLSRKADATGTHVPSYRDLRYSGMAEAVGGCIILIYSPTQYLLQGLKITPHPEMPPVSGTAYLLVPKNRDGPVGFIQMGWLAKFARWSDMGSKHKQMKSYHEG